MQLHNKLINAVCDFRRQVRNHLCCFGVCWSVLECVGVCLSVGGYVGVCWSVWECVGVNFKFTITNILLGCVGVCWSVLECVAACCSVLQRVAACCSTSAPSEYVCKALSETNA